MPAAACCLAEEEEELSLVDLMGGDGTEIVTGLETVEEPATEGEETVELVDETSGIRTITATFAGDMTIGDDCRKSNKIFENELEKQGGDINFTMRNIRDILLEDDMTLVNFEGTLTNSTYISR